MAVGINHNLNIFTFSNQEIITDYTLLKKNVFLVIMINKPKTNYIINVFKWTVKFSERFKALNKTKVLTNKWFKYFPDFFLLLVIKKS